MCSLLGFLELISSINPHAHPGQTQQREIGEVGKQTFQGLPVVHMGVQYVRLRWEAGLEGLVPAVTGPP